MGDIQNKIEKFLKTDQSLDKDFWSGLDLDGFKKQLQLDVEDHQDIYKVFLSINNIVIHNPYHPGILWSLSNMSKVYPQLFSTEISNILDLLIDRIENKDERYEILQSISSNHVVFEKTLETLHSKQKMFDFFKLLSSMGHISLSHREISNNINILSRRSGLSSWLRNGKEKYSIKEKEIFLNSILSAFVIENCLIKNNKRYKDLDVTEFNNTLCHFAFNDLLLDDVDKSNISNISSNQKDDNKDLNCLANIYISNIANIKDGNVKTLFLNSLLLFFSYHQKDFQNKIWSLIFEKEKDPNIITDVFIKYISNYLSDDKFDYIPKVLNKMDKEQILDIYKKCIEVNSYKELDIISPFLDPQIKEEGLSRYLHLLFARRSFDNLASDVQRLTLKFSINDNLDDKRKSIKPKKI